MENGSPPPDFEDLRTAVKLNSEATRTMTRLVEDLNVQLRVFSTELAALGARFEIYEQGLQSVQTLVQGKGGLLSQMEVAQEAVRAFREDLRSSRDAGKDDQRVRRENWRLVVTVGVSLVLGLASLAVSIVRAMRG